MAGKSRPGKAWKDGYNSYKASGRYEKNRTRRLENHLEAHPGDEVAAKAIKSISYRRAKPKAKQGWVNGNVMFSMMNYVGPNTNPNAPKGIQSTLGFTGQHTKSEQQKLARYMKLSRKTLNVMAYDKPKEEPKKKK